MIWQTSKMKTWNFGIAGAGNIADFHAKAIQSLGNARLTGITGTNTRKAKALSEKYACRMFSSFGEMVSCKEIDILTIATPSGAHLEPSVEAARHGKHVICEKPLEITTGRIDEMIAAHAESGTRLGCIFNYRFHEVVRVLKDAVNQGRFGTITQATVAVPWWRSDEYYRSSWRGTWKLDGGGALMNQSIHMVDMLQYMMGPVDSLFAYTTTLGHPQIEVEDTAVAVLRFRNKALGMIYGTTSSYPGQYRRLEITGTGGSAVMEENSLKVWQFADPLDDDRHIREMYSRVEGGGGVSDPMAIPFQPHARNIAAFIESVEKNTPFEIDGAEARKSVEIIQGIYESAKTSKEVRFQSVNHP